MFRKLTKWVCLLLGLAAAQHAGAFTLWGPLEAWQTADLDYGLRFYYQNITVDSGLGYDENGGPKDFGEGSRLTTPILTYAFDATFLEYFGSQGVAAVDSAMKLLNGLPSASSANLANFLTDGNQQVNYTAQALDMLDLKSTVMWLMVEHMGLLGETHVYDLQYRSHYDNAVCDYNYFTVNRSYDPVTYDPTTYVNGHLYGFFIWDGCGIGVNVGDAIETINDTPIPATAFTAVATPQGLQLGGYYLGLTRDDMGGLAFLYKKNNYALLPLDSNTVASPFNSSWQDINTTNPITGISNFVGVLGGAEKITFVKVAYDSLLGTNFNPITYNYSLPYVTNYKVGQLKVTRTVTVPDILFTAADLVQNGDPLPNDVPLNRTNSFIASGYVSPGGGVVPSAISPSLLIVLNNVGPVFWNESPVSFGGVDSQNYLEYPVFNWGTFDGSTNPPILYPNGSSLAELEQQVVAGAGLNMPLNTWAPVGTPTNNNNGTGGGAGVGGVRFRPPVHKKISQL
jgi:hypothetical protein